MTRKNNSASKYIILLLFWGLVSVPPEAAAQPPKSRSEIPLSAGGWKLWLDKNAAWKNDSLFLPPINLFSLPVHPPTCGWAALFSKSLPPSEAANIVKDTTLSMEITVPGTVEGYYWNAISGVKKGLGTSGDYVGVSWWGQTFDVPVSVKGQRIKLFFSEGVRQRAEVFVNKKLVGYELAQQSPFEVDITDAVIYGKANRLAVRITDPGGNFSWPDYTGTEWGNYYFPLSHGFGGILGPVVLRATNSLHVSDVFVKNKPSLKDIEADIELNNESTIVSRGTIEYKIVEAWQSNAKVLRPKIVFQKSAGDYNIAAGQTKIITVSASVPEAKLWEIRNANLYNLVVTLKDKQGRVTDEYTQRFGFRFLSIEDYGINPRIYLNGKRTFLLSSISWGFWPDNGIFPTPALAKKHIQSAMALGQNMLNFHRCEGNSLVLNTADEMGMLYYEEPGGYSSSRTKAGNPVLARVANFNVATELNSQRFLRMVKRDRNHPSLVIYNMVNEPGWQPDERAKKDMADAHRIDPTRLITYGSGFMNMEKEQPMKLHMLPYDTTQRTLGYCDVHNAGNSPGVYSDYFYKNPTSFRRSERDEKELFVWGEEGAIASPPQLEKIQSDIAASGQDGWDGADYKDWYHAYTNYIKDKDLGKYYPSLTRLITSLGNIMYYEHGRLIENVRIADGADLNVLNGYEDMKFDNMSGAVDIYRNLKGEPALIREYMRPLFVAVKARDKIGHTDDRSLVDFFVINEHAIPAGKYHIKAKVEKPDGAEEEILNSTVLVSGGDKFSNLVKEKIPVALNSGAGYYKITAELQNSNGRKLADGHDEILAVEWKSQQIKGRGAVLGGNKELLHFAKDIKKADIIPYNDTLAKLDYIVAGAVDDGKIFKTISPYHYRTTNDSAVGLTLDYFRGKNFQQQVDHRLSTATIDFSSRSKLIPGFDILGDNDFSLRWQGVLVPEVSGNTGFQLTWDDGVRVWIDDKLVIDEWKDGPVQSKTFTLALVAGERYQIKIEAFQAGGGWEISLKWKPPVTAAPADIGLLLKRVEEGTNLLLVDNAEWWVNELKNRNVFPSFQVFHPAKTWVGHNFFVREHPLFKDLPVNGGMNWEYQRLVMYDGPAHFGLYNMQGEEAVVSLVGGASHIVSTAVGIVRYGKGKILFSSLDLASNLMMNEKAAEVPKKIYCNYLAWGAGE